MSRLKPGAALPRPFSGRVAVLGAAVIILALFTACGTDFAEPPPISGARIETPTAAATVFRRIEVTPVNTPTPVATAVGPDGSVQRSFPPELDPSRNGPGLPEDAVIGFWTQYLSGSRLIVDGRRVDVHLCTDGSLFPGSPGTVVAAGQWGLRQSGGEWFQVAIGRQFRPGRISGFAQLSRRGAATVDLMDGVSVVSVTESELCKELQGQ